MPGKNPEKASANEKIETEIQRAMAEAEAAVNAMQGGTEERDAEASPPEAEGQPTPSADGQGESAAAAAEGGEPDDELEAEADLEVEEPSEEDELERAQAESAALKDKWLRAVADLENHKKRVKRDIDDAVTRATQNLLSSFLPTVDNLDRALEAAGADAPEQLVKGIEMVRDEFLAALARNGIEPVPSVGHPFDPAVHDALQQVDSEDHPPGTVTCEFEKGYTLGKRLLRPARVIVAGAGSTGTAEEEES